MCLDQNYRGIIAQSSDAHMCTLAVVLMEFTFGGRAVIAYSLVLLLFRLGCR